MSPSYRLGRSRIRVQVPRDQQRRYLAGSARCEADGGSHVATPRSLSHIMANSIAILQEEFGAIPTDEKTTSVTFQDLGEKEILLETLLSPSWQFAANRSQRYGRSAPYSRCEVMISNVSA